MGMTLKVYEAGEFVTRYVLIDNMPWFLLTDITKQNIIGYIVSTNFDTTNISKQTYNIAKEEHTDLFMNLYSLIGVCTLCRLLNDEQTNSYTTYVKEKLLPYVLTVIANTYKPSEEDNLILQVCHSKSSLEKARSISAYMSYVAKNNTAEPAIEQRSVEPVNSEKSEYSTSYTLSVAKKEAGMVFDNQYQTASKILINDEIIEKANLKSIAEVNDMYNFKRGQLLWYFEDIGYFKYTGTSGKRPKVIGDEGWLVICKIGNSVGRIMVTDKGLDYIAQHITAIKTCTCKPVISKPVATVCCTT